MSSNILFTKALKDKIEPVGFVRLKTPAEILNIEGSKSNIELVMFELASCAFKDSTYIDFSITKNLTLPFGFIIKANRTNVELLKEHTYYGHIENYSDKLLSANDYIFVTARSSMFMLVKRDWIDEYDIDETEITIEREMLAYFKMIQDNGSEALQHTSCRLHRKDIFNEWLSKHNFRLDSNYELIIDDTDYIDTFGDTIDLIVKSYTPLMIDSRFTIICNEKHNFVLIDLEDNTSRSLNHDGAVKALIDITGDKEPSKLLFPTEEQLDSIYAILYKRIDFDFSFVCSSNYKYIL